MCILCKRKDFIQNNIDISGCQNITNKDLLLLLNNELLFFNCSNCPLITEIPSFKHLQVLNCSNCPLLTLIPKMKSLEHLICTQCPSLKQIPEIETLLTLNCSKCLSLTIISQLNHLYDLNCSDCPSLVVIKQLANINTLNISNCPSLKYFPSKPIKRLIIEKDLDINTNQIINDFIKENFKKNLGDTDLMGYGYTGLLEKIEEQYHQLGQKEFIKELKKENELKQNIFHYTALSCQLQVENFIRNLINNNTIIDTLINKKDIFENNTKSITKAHCSTKNPHQLKQRKIIILETPQTLSNLLQKSPIQSKKQKNNLEKQRIYDIISILDPEEN